MNKAKQIIGVMAAALAAFFMPAVCFAADHWAVATLGAQHYVDEAAYTHQWNYGAGYELQQDNVMLSAGGYLNSYGKASYYGVAGYRLINMGRIHIAPAAGVVTGYRSWQAPVYHGLTPMVGLVTSIEGERVGANMLITPYFVALQIKFKLFSTY